MKMLTVLLFSSMILLAHANESFDNTIFKVQLGNTPQKIKLFNHGLASFEERLQMVERAEKSIDIEYFIYNADFAGRLFTQALLNKAKQGVKVRLLLDYLMIKSEISPFHAEELSHYGIEVKYFNPTSIFNLVKGQYRNHRKVLIIDNKEALTGGRNIGDEYFDLSLKFNFLDRDISVEGPIVESMQDTFESIWNSKNSKKIARPKMPKESQYNTSVDSEIDRYEQAIQAWKKSVDKAQNFLSPKFLDLKLVEQVRIKGKEELALEYQGSCENMSFNSEYPITNNKNRVERIIKFDLFDRIKNAQESILFDSPYFIANKESEEALKIALQNKVEVRLLTNGLNSTDAVYVFDVFDSIISKWVSRGLDPYVFKGDRPENYSVMSEAISHARFGVHAKSFVFDNKDVVIGTFNFDPRSSNYNTEMVLYCENNPELAQVIKSDIESRMKAGFHINTAAAIKESRFFRVGFLKKLEYLLLKLPSNLFDYLL